MIEQNKNNEENPNKNEENSRAVREMVEGLLVGEELSDLRSKAHEDITMELVGAVSQLTEKVGDLSQEIDRLTGNSSGQPQAVSPINPQGPMPQNEGSLERLSNQLNEYQGSLNAAS